MLTALILLIICSAIIVITLRWLDNTEEAPIDEIDPFQVIITSDELACEHSRRKREEVPWDEIHEIVLLTLSEGPLIPDRWLIFVGDDRGCSIPTEAHGAHHLWNEIEIRFPGFDFKAITDGREVAKKTVWKRTKGAH